MIITQELVTALHNIGLLCDVGLDYIVSNNYIGTTRTEFINKIKAHIESGGCPADYLPWSINTLVKSELIKHHPDFLPTGRFRVLGDPTIYNNLQEAKVALAESQSKNYLTYYLYCIEEETVDTSDPNDHLISWRHYH